MKNITTRQFSVLGDCGKIYQFMLDIYERDWRNGVAAPFFEYASRRFTVGWTYPVPTRIVSGKTMERLWHFVFMKTP